MINFCRISCLFLLYVFSPFGLLANGGGIYLVSSTMRSTDPIFRDIKDVTLLSEKLYIKLNSERADVIVKYVLTNNSDTDYLNLDYAFPVDYLEGGSNPSDRKWIGVADLSFKLNGNLLEYQYSEEKIKDSTPVMLNQYISGMSQSYIRRWFYTKLDIKKHSVINLEVHYSVETFSTCDGITPLNMWYLDDCTQRDFRYDFSPAKHWGDGIIRDFYVEIDMTESFLVGNGLTFDNTRGDAPSFTLNGLDFKRNGDKYEYRQRNFDLKKAESIYLTYNSSAITSAEVLSKYLILPSEYKVKVSSEKKSYPFRYISDLNLETAWVPTKSKNESIEFSFDARSDIAGFVILGGYYKNEQTYVENNRIKNIKVELKQKGKDWQEVYIEKPIPDFDYQTIYFNDLFSHPNAYVVDFYDVIDTELDIEKVRITIEDVYTGTKYDDTCISEILFFK